MINSKILCLSFLLAGLFTSCSLGQNKVVPPPMTPVDSPSSAKFNEKTQKFESTGGKFTINIAQTPSQIRDLGLETANKKGIDVGKMFVWQFEKSLYTIMYSNPLDTNGNPMPQNPNDFEDFKLGMRKGIARSNGKLISEKSISLNNYPGTEFRYISAEGVKFIGRVYLINSVGYQVVGGYGDDKTEQEVLQVLDSFQVTNESKQPQGK